MCISNLDKRVWLGLSVVDPFNRSFRVVGAQPVYRWTQHEFDPTRLAALPPPSRATLTLPHHPQATETGATTFRKKFIMGNGRTSGMNVPLMTWMSSLNVRVMCGTFGLDLRAMCLNVWRGPSRHVWNVQGIRLPMSPPINNNFFRVVAGVGGGCWGWRVMEKRGVK